MLQVKTSIGVMLHLSTEGNAVDDNFNGPLLKNFHLYSQVERVTGGFKFQTHSHNTR